MSTIAPPVKPLPEIPYRGIESFRYIDQRVFCAREEETWDLLSSILINRGVLLYGDSGSGKSSLINAGLIPAAIKENLWSHRLRVQPRRGREIKVERIPKESDGLPPYLPLDLVDPASQYDKALSFEISLEEFSKQIKGLKGRSIQEPRPLFIVDQFEEFVTLFEDASTGVAHQKEILNVLTSILHDEGLPVKMLFVFREEYLAKLNILFKAVPELLDQYVRLLPPRVEEAETIILAPFVDEELKARFAGKANRRHVKELEGPLAKTIAAQISQRSENGFINLSELQIVCRKLWESPDPVKYFQNNSSDIQKVLEGYFVDALKDFKDLYEPAIALLGHMITSTNTRNIVSEPDLKLFEKDNFTPEQITKALNALVDSKLVRREPRHKIHFYEIVSEFLVPWIREQKTARRAQIEAARIASETKQRLEQVERKKRNLWIIAIALSSLLVLSAVLGFLAHQSYVSENITLIALEESQRLRADEQRQKDEVQKSIGTLSALVDREEQVRLAAVNELIAMDKKGELNRSLVPFILAVVANDPSEQVAKAGKYFFDALKELNTIPASDPNQSNLSDVILAAAEKNPVINETASPAKVPPRVYFQLADDSQRARADKIANALRSIGFTIPAYQVVSSATRADELRYYEPRNDSESAAISGNLERALQKVREIDGQSWSSHQLAPSSSVRPGHFELWFAGDPVSPPDATSSSTPIGRVVLRLTFVNEQGNELSINNQLVTLEPVPFAGRQLIRTSSSLTARPGNYILFVQVPGYQLYRAEITLQGGEMNHRVRLVPTRSQP